MLMAARRTGIEPSARLAGPGVTALLLSSLLLASAGCGRPTLAGEGEGKGTLEPLLTLSGHQDMIFAIRFSPDGKILATASGDQTIKLWDSATGKLACTLEGHTAMVYDLAFRPDGKRLASVSGDWRDDPCVQGEVIVWDLASRRKALTLREHTGSVYSVAFSPNGKLLASGGGDGMVKVWDATIGRVARTLTEHAGKIYGLAYSPDGKWLASAEGDFDRRCTPGSTKLWKVARGREAFPLKGHRRAVFRVTFSPDGRRLASAGYDRTVGVWEVISGRPILTLHGHDDAVYGVAFSPNGRRVASASQDGTVKVWDAISGKEILSLGGHVGQAAVVAFSPDGKRLASANGKGHCARVWDLTRLKGDGKRGTVALSPADLDDRWANLAGEDARKAYRAIWTLVAAPEQALPFLRKRLPPAVAVPPDPHIARLIADLDDDSFAAREKATQELARLGNRAGPALHKVRDNPPSLEARARADRLLAKLGRPVPAPQELRLLRAVAALEQMGSPAAAKVLLTLAKGHAEARLTQQAKAALHRLAQSPR
jgi:WD40 repeat protein